MVGITKQTLIFSMKYQLSTITDGFYEKADLKKIEEGLVEQAKQMRNYLRKITAKAIKLALKRNEKTQ